MANMADVVVAVEDADFYVTAPSEVTAAESAKAGTVDVLAKDFDEAASKIRELIEQRENYENSSNYSHCHNSDW